MRLLLNTNSCSRTVHMRPRIRTRTNWLMAPPRYWSMRWLSLRSVCACWQKEVKSYDAICEEAFAAAKKHTSIKNREWIDSPWDDFFRGKDPMKCRPTAASADNIALIANKFSEEPQGFNLHNGTSPHLTSCSQLCSSTIEYVLNYKKQLTGEWCVYLTYRFGYKFTRTYSIADETDANRDLRMRASESQVWSVCSPNAESSRRSASPTGRWARR